MKKRKPARFLLIAGFLVVVGFIALTFIQDRLNLIIISIDTLRPDHLGCYGYNRDTSPNIDHLAREGILFTDVVSQSPWTLPSHVSMLTSKYPSEHSVVRDSDVLDPNLSTLAGLLREEGYRTAAFTGGGYMNHHFGLGEGFELYMDKYTDGTRDYSPFLDVHWSLFRSLVLDWLHSFSREPFFLFIHCYDVHKPYNPPARYVEPFYPACQGEVISFLDHNIVVFKEAEKPVRKVSVDSLTPDEFEHLVAHYDGEIRMVDEEVGILLETLDQLGIGDRTLLVVTSDHGEQFLEHGELGHRNTLYGEELRVPLIMRLPHAIAAGFVVREVVKIIDIMPTILDIMGFGGDGFSGRSLVSVMKRKQEPGSVILSEYREGGLAAIRDERFKLILSFRDDSEELYDLENDSEEKVDVSNEYPAVRDRLRSELVKRIQEQKRAGERYQGKSAREDQYITDQLKALGYISE